MLEGYLLTGAAVHRDLQKARIWLESAVAQADAELAQLSRQELKAVRS